MALILVGALTWCGCGDSDDTDSEPAANDAVNEPEVGDTSDADAPPDTADDSAGCLEITPTDVKFGGVVVGDTAAETVTLTACGENPLELASAEFSAGASAALSLEAPALPATLQPGESVELKVTFAPTAISGTQPGSGQPIFESAELAITSNAPDSPATVAVSGLGACKDLITAAAVIEEGTEVEVGTILHLSDASSPSCSGAPAKAWKWTVSAPAGANKFFKPDDQSAEVTIEVDAPGQYDFGLVVTDENDFNAPVPWTATVTASQ